MFGCLFGCDFVLEKKGSIVQTRMCYSDGTKEASPAIGKIYKCIRCGKRKGEAVGNFGTDKVDPDFLEMILEKTGGKQ
jgi:hypothetical protein